MLTVVIGRPNSVCLLRIDWVFLDEVDALDPAQISYDSDSVGMTFDDLFLEKSFLLVEINRRVSLEYLGLVLGFWSTRIL